MVQDVYKKHYFNTHDVFQGRRWEKRPWGFKLKYLVANHPEIALASFGFLVVIPAIIAFRYFTFNEEKSLALRKYKNYYAVVRDNDPKISDIKKEKELGRQYFPQ